LLPVINEPPKVCYINGKTPSTPLREIQEKVIRTLLFDEGKNHHHEAGLCPLNHERRDTISGIVKIVNSQSHLFEMVGTLHPPCGFACCLNGRQKKGDEHSDNRNDDKKFDECEGIVAS